MPKNYFDHEIAAIYDTDAAGMFRPEVLDPTVDFLAELAGADPVLELAIGTGRVALPLQQRGLHVAGIDLSPDMIAVLRAKPGGADIEVLIGDMTSTRIDGEFGLVYVVFNSIGNLLTQAEQVACFRNAAAHLKPNGYFVVELGVPHLEHLSPSRRHEPFVVSPTRLGIDEVTDFVAQQAVSHHYRIDGTKVSTFSTPWRWIWPSELDLMAQLAGMRLEGRWSTWTGEPFTEDSASGVSMWRLTT
jgi:SAM-dependent methyltransferase